LVQKSFLNFGAEREGAGTAVVEAVGFDDVYYYYSGRQIFDVSQVVNVEEVHGGRVAAVIVAVVDVDVEVPEVRSEEGKSAGVVPADEDKDEPFVEGVAQVVEHIVGHNQLMADTGYMLADLAVEAAQAEGDTVVAVVAVAVAAAFANDYFEIHSRNSHIKHFVQQEAEEAEEESTGNCKVQQEVVHVAVVQQRLPTMPNNLAVKAVGEEVQEAAEAAEA
jgi:hypothetical protein